MATKWNLNRALVIGGAALILLGLLATKAPLDQSIPFLVGTVAAIVLAFYAPAWMYLVAGILVSAFTFVVIFVFGALQGIIHPGSGLEGVGLMLMLLGSVIALVAGIVGFVQARRNSAPSVRAIARAPMGTAALLIAALFVGLMVSSLWSTRDVEAGVQAPPWTVEGPEARTQLFASGIAFGPREINMTAGQLTMLTIENRDPVFHTFSYVLDGETHNAYMPADMTFELPFKFDTPQTIHFYCAPHSQGPDDMDPASMWGTLTVA